MRRIFLSLFAILAGCLGFAPPAPAQERLTVGYTNLEGAKIPLPLGKEMGLFAKRGLDLEIVRVSPGYTAIPKLLSGDIQLFLGNGDPVVKAVVTQGASLCIIASLGEDSFQLVARAPISTVEALKGKRVGVSNPGSSADRIARATLKKLGLDPERDVRVVATGGNESRARLELVLNGEIDAAVVNTENVMALGARRNDLALVADLEKLGIFVSGADLSVTRSLVQSRRDTVKRLLSGLVEAIQRAKTDADLTRRIYRQHATVSEPAALEWRATEFVKTRIPDIPYPNRRAITGYLEEAGATGATPLEAVADFSLLTEVTQGR
ncbi:MAG: hypothetical protein A3F90_18750 [Deltaproteobacteria bacterium RIFCSPLOWO2_12_FULL_60_19]|nr:MAG: hypothetical protein A3F90_18750 [Deltaproteobacteria bacterium RIFCSPLOWO2_12_FULL_60_19]